jgi:hypothetical protein
MMPRRMVTVVITARSLESARLFGDWREAAWLEGVADLRTLTPSLDGSHFVARGFPGGPFDHSEMD